MSSKNAIYKRTRHEFLLSYFFKQPYKYDILLVKEFALECRLNGDTQRWEVAVWRLQDYLDFQKKKRKAGLQPSLLVGKE